MELFRITREEYADDLTGTGAKKYGGRWNRPGLAALYTSEARSLALLELLVHFNSIAALRQNYVFITLEIDEGKISTIQDFELPKNLISFNNERLWQITDDYFLEKNTLAFRVPSVIIPMEYNVILNPNHPDLKNVRKIRQESAILDNRLFRSL